MDVVEEKRILPTVDGGQAEEMNFIYTDRKNVLSELVNANGDTDLTAHNSEENVYSAAKVQNKNHYGTLLCLFLKR